MTAASPPLVSVVVPLHEGAASITATLDSILLQGDLAIEVLVVDDRSTDEGPELARRHALRPRLLRSARPGPAAARNLGAAEATGHYVVFLDCDDLLDEGALQHRLEVARALAPGTIVAGRHEDLVGEERRRAELQPDLGDDPAAALLERNQLAIHGPLVPRACLLPFEEDLWGAEDWGLWLRLALTGTRFFLLPQVDCVYRRRDGGLSRDLSRRADDAVRLLERAKAWCREAPWPRRLVLELARRRALHLWLRHRARRRLSSGELRAGVVDVGRAFAAHPLAGATSLPAHALGRLWSITRDRP